MKVFLKGKQGKDKHERDLKVVKVLIFSAQN